MNVTARVCVRKHASIPKHACGCVSMCIHLYSHMGVHIHIVFVCVYMYMCEHMSMCEHTSVRMNMLIQEPFD